MAGSLALAPAKSIASITYTREREFAAHFLGITQVTLSLGVLGGAQSDTVQLTSTNERCRMW